MTKTNAILVTIFSLAWTVLISRLTVHVLGEDIFTEIIGALCGISLGMCIGYGSVTLTLNSKKQKTKD